VAGAYPLAIFGAAGRHDAPALLLAGIALLRALRRGRVGAPEAALFALAAFVKPNVVGAAAGALACEIAARPPAAWPAARGGAALGAACVAGLHAASDGAWVTHLFLSTQTTPLLGLWRDQMKSRLPFFALPLAAAGWCAWRARGSPGAPIALCALAASCAWTGWSLAKVRSASNYCMDPFALRLPIL